LDEDFIKYLELILIDKFEDEIYAPVIKFNLIRILFATATIEDLEIAQFDATTAFLHGNLKGF
jgi:hypothetical protein